jgi:hypothetical protein
MIEYEIREFYDGKFSAVQLTKKRIGRWPFRRWITVYSEVLIDGVNRQTAEAKMKERVVSEKDNAVKHTLTYTDRGELHRDHYPM